MRQRKKRIQGQSAPNKRPLEGEWSPLSDAAKKSGVIPYILVRGEGKMAAGQPEAASVCKAKGWWRWGRGGGPEAEEKGALGCICTCAVHWVVDTFRCDAGLHGMVAALYSTLRPP